MIRKILTRVVFVICLLTQSVSADEGTKEVTQEWTGPRVAGTVLIVEGAIGLNAYLASLNPKVYGVVAALAFPLGGGESGVSNTTLWASLASVEALAFYDITLNEDKMSKSEIFKNNFIGWHAAAGIMAVTGFFAGDFNKNKKLSLNYMAAPHGGKFILSYRF